MGQIRIFIIKHSLYIFLSLKLKQELNNVFWLSYVMVLNKNLNVHCSNNLLGVMYNFFVSSYEIFFIGAAKNSIVDKSKIAYLIN